MTRLLDLYGLVSPLLIVGGYLLGHRTGSRNAVRKTHRPGVLSTDFSWPGKPLRIVDAEVLTPDAIDAAVRGD